MPEISFEYTIAFVAAADDATTFPVRNTRQGRLSHITCNPKPLVCETHSAFSWKYCQEIFTEIFSDSIRLINVKRNMFQIYSNTWVYFAVSSYNRYYVYPVSLLTFSIRPFHRGHFIRVAWCSLAKLVLALTSINHKIWCLNPLLSAYFFFFPIGHINKLIYVNM